MERQGRRLLCRAVLLSRILQEHSPKRDFPERLSGSRSGPPCQQSRPVNWRERRKMPFGEVWAAIFAVASWAIGLYLGERARRRICGMLGLRAALWKCDPVNKFELEFELESNGSPAWIRTTIHGSKGRCPTIRRPGNGLGGNGQNQFNMFTYIIRSNVPGRKKPGIRLCLARYPVLKSPV